MGSSSIVLEACVDSVEAAVAAEAAGADRLELCSALELGGITPSPGLLRLVCQRVAIPVQVLLRPRPGNFVYSQSEMEVMLEDMAWIAEAGASGIVIGALDLEGNLAVQQMESALRTSKLPLTFHRAFDHAKDHPKIAQQLLEIGFERILTSGGRASATAGGEMLAKLQETLGQQMIIMPGGGVSPENITHLIETTDCQEFHFSAVRSFTSPSDGPNVGKGGPENTHFIPFPEKVARIRAATAHIS